MMVGQRVMTSAWVAGRSGMSCEEPWSCDDTTTTWLVGGYSSERGTQRGYKLYSRSSTCSL